MKRFLLFLAALAVTGHSALFAQAPVTTGSSALFASPKAPLDLGAVIKECEKIQMTQDSMSISVWMPNEYWEASLKDNPRVSDEVSDKLLSLVSNYIMILVVDAHKTEIGGALGYAPLDVILKNTTLTLPSGQKLTPLEEETLPPESQKVFSYMKPVFAKMMGKLGENAHILLFSNKDKDGKTLLNSTDMGKMVIDENGHTSTWRLPLGSLLPALTCPKCNEQFPGNYLYCPYDGTKLK